MTITIHRGEVLQIGRNIIHSKVKVSLRGSLFGLRTESRQPVVQFVCGGDKNRICEEKLGNGHGLLKLGEWVVSPSAEKPDLSHNYITLVFNEEGDLSMAYDESGKETTYDILKGQSAFRLYAPLRKELAGAGEDNSPISTEKADLEEEKERKKKKEIQVMETQWYSTADGVNILREIYTGLPDKGFQIVNMSRDKSTEDVTLFLAENALRFAVYFPPGFPGVGNPEVLIDEDREQLELNVQGAWNKLMQAKEIADIFCNSLLAFIHAEKEKRDRKGKNWRNNYRQNKRENLNSTLPTTDQKKNKAYETVSENKDRTSTQDQQPSNNDGIPSEESAPPTTPADMGETTPPNNKGIPSEESAPPTTPTDMDETTPPNNKSTLSEERAPTTTPADMDETTPPNNEETPTEENAPPTTPTDIGETTPPNNESKPSAKSAPTTTPADMGETTPPNNESKPSEKSAPTTTPTGMGETTPPNNKSIPSEESAPPTTPANVDETTPPNNEETTSEESAPPTTPTDMGETAMELEEHGNENMREIYPIHGVSVKEATRRVEEPMELDTHF